MEILREMINVLTKYKSKRIEVLGNPTKNKSQVYQFYEGISNGTLCTDEEAATHFFDGDIRNQSYKNLKVKLKNRLLNTVFFVDTTQNMFSDVMKAHNNCYKEWAAATIFSARGAPGAALDIYLKVLKQSKKTELTGITIEIARKLRSHYGSRRFDKKKFEEYDKLLKESSIIREKELRAEEYYLYVTQYYLQHKTISVDFLERINNYSELLRKDLEKYPTFRILLYAGLVEVTKLMANKDYESTIDFCNCIIDKFLTKPLVFKSGVALFSNQIIVCHTQLNQFEAGQKTLLQLFKYIEPASFNWFKGKELYMYLLFHTAKYQAAYDSYIEVIAAKNFEKLPPSIQATWSIFNAYIHFLIARQLIQPIDNDNKRFKFRVGKFLNEVPKFSQDKRGANISILIIQILFMIVNKKYNQAINRIGAIEKYTSSYLKKDENFRSNCFIKMLLEIPKGDFHKVAVERKAAKYRKRFSEVPLDLQMHSIEIIPYEHLWELLLNVLTYKRYRAYQHKAY